MANESSKPNQLFDVRIVERNIQKGLITRKEYDAYLQALEDNADRAVAIEADFVEGVLEDRDSDEE